jgi:SAM-dependent methyltransferase
MNTPVPAAVDGARFGFGRNWQRFLGGLSDARIAAAEESLRALLGVDSLQGRSFLDIGSGSGLFSLAAMRLGAQTVRSFDYDADSVACTRELRQRYYPEAANWLVERGSVLDVGYLQALGTWDVVYSWGVLHHTGNLAAALANAAAAVNPQGQLVIAIYNDQGWRSRAWWWIKRIYNSGIAGRALVLALFMPYSVIGALVMDLLRARKPWERYAAHVRGMSHLHDWIDWLGGFPFEVASRSAIESYFASRGFALERLISCGKRHGCNQFAFRRQCASSS